MRYVERSHDARACGHRYVFMFRIQKSNCPEKSKTVHSKIYIVGRLAGGKEAEEEGAAKEYCGRGSVDRIMEDGAR